ncbi:MAG TPA: hypothetical protein VFK02_32685 [Kofleriaceae bacterium]|nr:hypothetical protein [Kofleriaceae bacterium]
MRTYLGSALALALSLAARTSHAAPTPPADGSPPPDDVGPEPPPPEPPPPEPVNVTDKETLLVTGATLTSKDLARTEVLVGNTRGVAEDFLVLPDGADVGGRLRLITADDGLGTGKLKLTDVALLDLEAQWGFASGFELDGAVSALAKQPSATREHILQGGSLTLRRDLPRRTALAVSGSAGALLGVAGYEVGAATFLTHKHRLNDIVAFALAAGANGTFVRPGHGGDGPTMLEGAGHASVLVRAEPVWGGWMGVGYALPVLHRGSDPVSGMAIDPQPRLDLELGSAVQLSKTWDLSVELSIIDRGDRAAPATRLPILDGGFDQIQLSVGVSRRIDLEKHSRRPREVSEPMMKL